MKTQIYQVKKGYNNIASFDNLEAATKFFSEILKASGKNLCSVSGKGKEPKKAHYWGGDVQFSIEIKEAHMYPSKKDAEFAVFNADEGGEEDLAD